MKLGWLTLACAGSVAAASAASAHHSASACDLTKKVIVEGAIGELEWKNPHRTCCATRATAIAPSEHVSRGEGHG
jgi:hypothetical protein